MALWLLESTLLRELSTDCSFWSRTADEPLCGAAVAVGVADGVFVGVAVTTGLGVAVAEEVGEVSGLGVLLELVATVVSLLVCRW